MGADRQYTYDAMFLASPKEHFSVYATLVDIHHAFFDGRNQITSVWRDGLKEREYMVMHDVPRIEETKCWSNWIADPTVDDASAAPMRCVARTLACSKTLFSSNFCLSPLDGCSLDGRLAPHRNRGESLVKSTFSDESEARLSLSAVLEDSGCSVHKATNTIHV